MRYFIATASDGTIFKRSSKNRAYSHCVAVYSVVRAATPEEAKGRNSVLCKGSEGWARGEWASRKDLADKNAASDHGQSWPRTVLVRAEVLDAREVSGPEFRKTEGRR
jgi:hypothetical protein